MGVENGVDSYKLPWDHNESHLNMADLQLPIKNDSDAV